MEKIMERFRTKGRISQQFIETKETFENSQYQYSFSKNE